MLAGVDPAAGTAQVFAEGQMGAGPIGQPRRAGVRGECSLEVGLGVAVGCEQGTAVFDDRGRALQTGARGELLQLGQPGAGESGAVAADGGAEQVDGGQAAVGRPFDLLEVVQRGRRLRGPRAARGSSASGRRRGRR